MNNPLVVVLADSHAPLEQMRAALEVRWPGCQLLRMGSLRAAQARLAGGGVRAVVLDLEAAAAGEWVAELPRLVADEAGIPAWLWRAQGAGDLRDRASALGARMLEVAGSAAPVRDSAPSRATVIAVYGVKGGIGTTTVALNLAAVLRRRGSVILAEARSFYGSLSNFFAPGRMAPGLSAHLGREEELGRSALGKLWPVPRLAGLQVLFGPQSQRDCGPLSAGQAKGLVEALSASADFVVLDLAPGLGEANEAFLAASRYLNLVVTPHAGTERLARWNLDSIQTLAVVPASIGVVVVNQGIDQATLVPADLGMRLGLPVLATIPPAGQLCRESEHLHLPMVEVDGESLAASSFLQLAEHYQTGESVLPRLSRRRLDAPPASASL